MFKLSTLTNALRLLLAVCFVAEVLCDSVDPIPIPRASTANVVVGVDNVSHAQFSLSYPIAPRILLSNDDGWAVAQIRALYEALKEAGYKTILSAPAVDKSGTGSRSASPAPLDGPCEFESCPPGSPAVGANASDPNLNYVNAYPVDAVNFGLDTLAPALWHAPAQLVLSGPNVGNNLGLTVFGSGTIGAAAAAASASLPAIAFSGASGTHVSYTTLTNASLPSTQAARTYAVLALRFVAALTSAWDADSDAPLLPAGTFLSVNLPAAPPCSPRAVRFTLTRVLPLPPPPLGPADAEFCGRRRLRGEAGVVRGAWWAPAPACWASVSVLDARTKLDAGREAQQAVLDRLRGFLSCIDDSDAV